MLKILLRKSREHINKVMRNIITLMIKGWCLELGIHRVEFQHHHVTSRSSHKITPPRTTGSITVSRAGFKILYCVWVEAMPSTGCSGQWLKVTEILGWLTLFCHWLWLTAPNNFAKTSLDYRQSRMLSPNLLFLTLLLWVRLVLWSGFPPFLLQLPPCFLPHVCFL